MVQNQGNVAVASRTVSSNGPKPKKEKLPPALKGGTGVQSAPVKVAGTTLDIKDSGEQKPRWNVDPEPRLIAAAIQNDFLDYVEEEARGYVKQWLGYINPVMIVILSTNLRRLLKLAEVELLGGSDGADQICQLKAGDNMQLSNVETFEELTLGKQSECRFVPGWGLRLDNEGVMWHLLNVMSGGAKSLDEALLSCKPGQISLSGNKLVVRTGNDPENAVAVSGRVWYTTSSGETRFGHGRIGDMEKALKVTKHELEDLAKRDGREVDPAEVSVWRFDTFEMDLQKLLAPARERQEQARKSVSQVRAGVTNNVARLLLTGQSLALAKAAPIRQSTK